MQRARVSIILFLPREYNIHIFKLPPYNILYIMMVWNLASFENDISLFYIRLKLALFSLFACLLICLFVCFIFSLVQDEFPLRYLIFHQLFFLTFLPRYRWMHQQQPWLWPKCNLCKYGWTLQLQMPARIHTMSWYSYLFLYYGSVDWSSISCDLISNALERLGVTRNP